MHRRKGNVPEGWKLVLRSVDSSRFTRGEVRTQESMCADGRQPAILDVVEVTLTAKQDRPYQPENYLIDSSVRWQKIGTIPASSLTAIEERPPHLWLQPGGRTDRIH